MSRLRIGYQFKKNAFFCQDRKKTGKKKKTDFTAMNEQ